MTARFTPFIIPPGSWQSQADYATAHKAVAEVVIHRNSGGGKYTEVLVGSNASAKSKAMAKDLAARFKRLTGLSFPSGRPDGVKYLKYKERGDACVRYFREPVCLGEFNFNDVKAQDDWSEANWKLEAKAYYEMLVAQFPAGGAIGIAAGHFVNGPGDSGAEDFDHDVNEREMNWRVANELARLLTQHGTIVVPPPGKPQPFSGQCRIGEIHVRVEKQALVQAALDKLRVTVFWGRETVPALDSEMRSVLAAEANHATSLVKAR